MLIFEIVVGLLLLGVVLALVANRFDIPYPALLALGGVAVALWPGAPEVTLDPHLALALFVSPVLLDAAFDASIRDIRANVVPVGVLAIVAVGLTIVAVALVSRALVPGMGWPAAIALGAIVAPPDASAATAVLRRLRPPNGLVVILEGESLFNDATALLVYRIAVGVVATGVFSGWSVVPMLLLTCGGGVLAGIVLAHVYLPLHARIDDIPTAVLTQFLSTFAVWVLAERLGLSAIVTMVAYAMTLARNTGMMGGRRRIAAYAVWDVVTFVLNVLAFILIGLQLRGIIARLGGASWSGYVTAAIGVCITVIVVRLALWMPFNWLRHTRAPRPTTTTGAGLLIGWCGMRGIVTLAAALALPDGPGGFPHRDFIVLAAFAVVLYTLVVQGLTLRPLLQRLQLNEEDSVTRELEMARVETARAAFETLKSRADEPGAKLLLREYAARLRAKGEGGEASSLVRLQQHAVSVQRRRLVELRATSKIGDYAFHAAEEEIDLLELGAEGRVHPGDPEDPGDQVR